MINPKMALEAENFNLPKSSVENLDIDHNTIMFLACRSGNLEMIEILLTDRRADPNLIFREACIWESKNNGSFV